MLVPPIFTVSAALEVESEQASKTRLKRLCATQMVERIRLSSSALNSAPCTWTNWRRMLF